MIELSEEQRRELEQPGPVSVRDPQTNETYVLVRSDVYERMQAILEDDVLDTNPFLAELAPEDWEDVSNYEPRP